MEIIGSIGVAISQSILFYGKEIGISMIIFEAILNGILLYIMNRKNKIINKNGLLLLVPIILLSSTYFIFASKVFYVSNILIIIVLNILMHTITTNKKGYFSKHLYTAFRISVDSLETVNEVIDYTKENAKSHIKDSNAIRKVDIKKLTTSILIVLAVVGVVIILLASADSIFAGMFSGIGKIITNLNIKNIVNTIIRLAIILAVYFLVLSFILKLQNQKHKEPKEIGNISDKYEFTLKLLLIALNLVYVVFCYIQISSLFLARINVNIDYATYARTGFFQLMFVSFINFAIILLSNKFNSKKEKIIKVLNIFLVIFTIIIVLSSMFRMYMYEMEYGLTYLRTFVYIILLTELAIFVPTTIYIFNEKFDFIKIAFIIVLSVYCVINFINIEKIIISKNISRKTTKVPTDYVYIQKIATEDSYKMLEEKLKENIENDKKVKIEKALLHIINNNKEMKWQEFNISRWKVKQKNVNKEELTKQIEEQINQIQEENEKLKEAKRYLYDESISENERYTVEVLDQFPGMQVWAITKITDKGTKATEVNKLTITAASKIKFYENGLGFLENPETIYCAKADLLVTYDSGKTFTKINFPKGEFTLSDPGGEEWQNCYDYFYLPTKESDGTLTVLASGGYEGGYNHGLTRAKYESKDNGHTWQFVGEIFKEETVQKYNNSGMREKIYKTDS
ncbi:MAG: DUF4173 domain-containing protein [Clostridia bacterium]|nr:DUF4173 domain-containing protein [Clostridia bacterium]